MTYKDCNHAVMPGAMLKCPACKAPRLAKQGTNMGSGKEVWYMGCEGCPAPDGIMADLNLKAGTPLDEVVDYIRTQALGQVMRRG